MRAIGTATVLAMAAYALASTVRVDGDRVTAHFAGVSVRDALDAMATAAGAELHGAVVTERQVTLDLDGVPLEDALQRLLGTQSFLVRYGEGGRAKAIVLRGGAIETPVVSKRSPAAGVPIAPAAPSPQKPAFPLVLGRLFERHRPIALNEPLALALGEERATMPRLLEAAMVEEDGVTRNMASQAVLSALERGGRYRRSFMRTLHRLDDEQIAAIAGSADGARFQTLLEYLAAQSREPALQKKAETLLERFRDVGSLE